MSHLSQTDRDRLRQLYYQEIAVGEKPADVKRDLMVMFPNIKSQRTIDNIIEQKAKKDEKGILQRAQMNVGYISVEGSETKEQGVLTVASFPNQIESLLDENNLLELEEIGKGAKRLENPGQPLTGSYDDYLIESLKNPQEAKAYLEACAEDLDPRVLELAKEDVKKAINFTPETSEDYEIKPLEPKKKNAGEFEVKANKRTVELLASDIHYPYENKSACALFLKVAKDLQPDIICLLGDVMDCYAVSSHDKDADRATPSTFKAELDYTREKLEELRAVCPKSRIIYKEGNHETRLSRYINKNASVLSKLKCVTLPSLLDLDSLNIEWMADNQRLRIGKLHHIHGHEVGGSGLSPARAKYTRMQCNFIFGHLHTEDKHRTRAYDGSQHGAYANPCLCDLEPEYLHHAHNWSNGFAKIEYESDGTFQVDQIMIVQTSSKSPKARCNVSGKIYAVDMETL